MNTFCGLEKFTAKWVCPECHWETHWTYEQLVMQGSPVCIHCDTDMEVIDNSGNYREQAAYLTL